MFLVVALNVKVMGLVKVQLDHVFRLKRLSRFKQNLVYSGVYNLILRPYRREQSSSYCVNLYWVEQTLDNAASFAFLGGGARSIPPPDVIYILALPQIRL